jgi:hypothetical protein
MPRPADLLLGLLAAGFVIGMVAKELYRRMRAWV